jgi:SAM-dependent methyltransferase
VKRLAQRFARQVAGPVREYLRARRRARAAATLVDLLHNSPSRQLDLGAGGAGRAGTIGIDLDPRADLVWDLAHGIPADDDSIDAIHSDHFFEHLALRDVVCLLADCHRVLRVGGRLRFTVPHIDPYVDAWLAGDKAFIDAKITDVPPDQAALYATPFDRISWLLLRDGEHRSLFDRRSIVHKVELAGFDRVTVDEYRPSLDGSPRFSSVYVDAVK